MCQPPGLALEKVSRPTTPPSSAPARHHARTVRRRQTDPDKGVQRLIGGMAEGITKQAIRGSSSPSGMPWIRRWGVGLATRVSMIAHIYTHVLCPLLYVYAFLLLLVVTILTPAPHLGAPCASVLKSVVSSIKCVSPVLSRQSFSAPSVCFSASVCLCTKYWVVSLIVSSR